MSVCEWFQEAEDTKLQQATAILSMGLIETHGNEMFTDVNMV